MVILEFTKINEYNNFSLKEKNGNKTYSLFLEFYGIDNPKIGDFIAIDKNLLNPSFEGYAQPYAFELTNEEPTVIKNSKEYVILNTNKTNYVLKRIYG